MVGVVGRHGERGKGFQRGARRVRRGMLGDRYHLGTTVAVIVTFGS